jgi:hypothetical protein
VAYSLNQQVTMVCEFQESIRQLAHFAGQYFVNINDPAQSLASNFDSCVMGAMSTNYWINFNDHFLRMTFEMIAKLTHACQFKK